MAKTCIPSISMGFMKTTGALRRSPVPFTANGCFQDRRRILKPSCASTEDDPKGGDGGLSSVFNQFVFVKGIKPPAASEHHVHPSPLMPPTAVVEQALTTLQRNDWPEPDAGVRSAFNLTLSAAEGQPEAGDVRSWKAAEEWLTWARFHALLHVSYTPLLNCDSWKAISPLVFPSTRYENKALQAVEVRARPRPSKSDATAGGSPDTALRSYTYTFCLERQQSGVLQDCWVITGVRIGNYAL